MRTPPNAFGDSDEGLLTLELCSMLSCTPTELSSRITNLDEIILIYALARKRERESEAWHRQRFLQPM